MAQWRHQPFFFGTLKSADTRSQAKSVLVALRNIHNILLSNLDILITSISELKLMTKQNLSVPPPEKLPEFGLRGAML